MDPEAEFCALYLSPRKGRPTLFYSIQLRHIICNFNESDKQNASRINRYTTLHSTNLS